MFMTSSSPHVEDVERMSDHPSLLGETSSADAEGEDETDELRVDAILVSLNVQVNQYNARIGSELILFRVLLVSCTYSRTT